MKLIKNNKFKIFSITMLMVVFIFLFWFFNQNPETASAVWWNDSWAYRKAITINHDYVEANLTDFPVLVSLTDTDLGAHSRDDGGDIVFIDSEGKKLSHEIESFATSTGVLAAWVKTDISSTTDTLLYMYYGNAAAASQEDAESVWDSNYKGVWHMAEDPSISTDGDCGGGANEICDSTTNSNDANNVGGIVANDLVDGQIGKGIEFDGASTDYFTISHDASLNITGNLTISAWIQTSQAGNYRYIFSSMGAAANYDGYGLVAPSPSSKIGFWSDTTYAWRESTTNVNDGNMTYITAVLSGTTITFYRNGDINGSSACSAPDPLTGTRAIGSYDGSANFTFAGLIDELRVSNISRSASWIKTEYNNQNSPSTFLSIGTEEVGGGPVGYWSFDEGYGATAHDDSGQGNDGTLYNGVSWQEESMCISGKCLWLDGASSTRVDVNSPDNLQEFSYCFWIKPTSLINQNFESSMRFISKPGFIGIDNNGQIDFEVSTGGVYPQVKSTENLKSNKWSYVCGVFYGVGDGIEIYINGNNKSDLIELGDNTKNDDSSDITVIGSTHNVDYYNYEGFIDEVKIYPYARTAEQVKQDYAAGLAGAKTRRGVSAAFGSASEKWMSDGLVGYWKFDESATTSGAVDSSGNDYNGSYEGNASTTAGKFGSSLNLDGNNDYVSLSGVATTTFVSDFSVSLWFYSNDLDSAQEDIIGNGTSPASFNVWVLRSDSSGDLAFRSAGDGGVGDIRLHVDEVISTSTWYHVVASYRADTGYTEVTLNGELVISGYSPAGGFDHEYAEFRIGDDLDTRDWNGKMDEVRLYNRALTVSEAKKLYEWAPGPVAHWKFDEKSGDTAYDSIASSSTAGGHDGAKMWMATSTNGGWTSGKYGSALEFDGLDDYVDFGDMDEIEGQSGLTYEAWIYKTSGVNFDGIISKYFSGAGTKLIDLLLAGSLGGTDDIFARVSNGDNSYGYTNENVISDNTWQHVAMVFNGLGGSDSEKLKVYVDGIERTLTYSGTLPSQTPTSTAFLKVGLYSGGGGQYFNGKIDDVRIYNYARTQKQILEDMNGGRPAIKQKLLHLKFDEGYGEIAHDESSNHFNGTLHPGTGGSNTATSAMWSLAGKTGGAMEFDGTDDYVDVGEISAIASSTEISMSVWIKAGATETYQFAVDYSYNNQNRVRVGLNPSEQAFFNSEILDNSVGVSGSVDLSGAWHQISLVRTSDYLIGYVDGEQIGSPAACSHDNGDMPGIAALNIGREGANTYTYYLDGLIDEVKIYPYALTEEEIKLDYNNSKSAVIGALSTESDGVEASNSASREYCVPGDTATCNSPVLELKMDEKSGSMAYDTSGNGNDGLFMSIASSPTWSRGKFGSALEFDGTDDYLVVSDDASLDNMHSFTLSSWIKIPDTNDAYMIMDKDYGDADSRYGFICTSGIIRFHSADSISYLDSNSSIAPGAWTHVTAVRDEDSGNRYIYINGVLDNSDANADNTSGTFGDDSDLLIGVRQDGVDHWFKGGLDDVKIYDYARTPAQIAWDYNKGKPIAEWRFDECSGSTIHDESGNGNDGAITIGLTGTQSATGDCNTSNSASAWYNGRTGHKNASLNFDGTDDYAEISHNSDLSFGDGDFSISFWMNADEMLSTDWVLGKVESGGLVNYQFRFINDNQIRFEAYDTAWKGPTMSGTLSSGQWYYIVGVREGADMLLYLNGVYNSGAIGVVGTLSENSSPLRIGWDERVSTRYFDGQIDEVKIYNYALTPHQVKILYNDSAVNFQ